MSVDKLRCKSWYHKRLASYCTRNLGLSWEDDIEFYPDPDINKWKFDYKGFRHLLICNNHGKITHRKVDIS